MGQLTLLLFMLGVLADNHDAALALDDLALFADGFHRGTNLHVDYLLFFIRNYAVRRSGLLYRRSAADWTQFLLRQVIRPRVRS